MSAQKALVALGLTLGLGAGTTYAVHEVGELNRQADRIEACLKQPNVPAEQPIRSFCHESVPNQAEANGLRRTAETTGELGWIAFAGTFIGGFLVFGELELEGDNIRYVSDKLTE